MTDDDSLGSVRGANDRGWDSTLARRNPARPERPPAAAALQWHRSEFGAREALHARVEADRGDYFRRAWSGRIAGAAPPLSPIDDRTFGRTPHQPVGAPAGRRGRRLLGRRDGPAVRASTLRHVSKARACRNLARRDHGSRQPGGALEDGDAAPLPRPRVHAARRAGNLRRRVSTVRRNSSTRSRRPCREQAISATPTKSSQWRDGRACRGFGR